MCYKYPLRSTLGTNLFYFSLSSSCFGLLSLALYFPTMEDKRGLKREHSPSAKGSPTPSDTKTPPSVPSRSPPPPGSPSEVSSRRLRSPVFEQGVPSTICDFEFAQCLFNELNHAFLGPPDDDKIIILSGFDEKKRRCMKRSIPAPKTRLLLL
jgi:hypothetical protein